MGFRVLGRIRVKCYLQDCSWQGDFSELDDHLTNSDSHKDKNNSTTATTLKDLGNERFTAGRFEEALKLYEKALVSIGGEETENASPMRAVLYSNIAAACLKLGRPQQAAEACEKAIKAGNTEPKVYVRWNQALLQRGKFNEGVKIFENLPTSSLAFALDHHKKRAIALKTNWDESGLAIEKGDYETAKVHLASVLQDQNARLYSRVVSRAALVEAHIGNIDLALRLSLEAARSSPDDEQAWIARAYALVSSGQFDEAMKSARQALRLNPDDASAKTCMRFVKFVETQVTTARNAADKHEYETARRLFHDLVSNSSALPKTSPLRVQLLAERAHASYGAKMYEDALKDATLAIYQQDDNQRAWLTRLYCLRELGRHEEAVKDARELLNRWGANDLLIRNAAEKAEFELRKSKRPDLYGLLNVSSLASELEIKQAYKQKALVFHPDKLSPNATEEERKRCEENFKLLGTALDVLGNQEKRELWDKGFDVQGIQEELERRRRRSHHG